MSAIYLFSPVCKLPIFSRNYVPEKGVIVSFKGVRLILKVLLLIAPWGLERNREEKRKSRSSSNTHCYGVGAGDGRAYC